MFGYVWGSSGKNKENNICCFASKEQHLYSISRWPTCGERLAESIRVFMSWFMRVLLARAVVFPCLSQVHKYAQIVHSLSGFEWQFSRLEGSFSLKPEARL